MQVNVFFTGYSSSFENTNLTNHSSNELEILHVSRFPVHRRIIFFKDYQSWHYIITQAMSKQVNHVSSGPEILPGNWTSSWKV